MSQNSVSKLSFSIEFLFFCTKTRTRLDETLIHNFEKPFI